MSVSENGIQSAMQRLTAAQAEIARLTAERDAAMAGRVKVKPLVWEEPSSRNNYTHLARSIFGEYYVHIDGGRHSAWLEANTKPYEVSIGESVGSLYAAQTLAQADYEARVRANLHPDTERAEPVAWRWRHCDGKWHVQKNKPEWFVPDRDVDVEMQPLYSTPQPAPDPQADQPVTLVYTNWRGETAQRTIIPRRVWFGSTDWHPEPQWLLTALDVEKQADRDFALKDFGAPAPQAEPVARPAGWFCFDASTGEYTAEWCSVKPHDATGFVPLYSAPQARKITVQEAAQVLLGSLQSRPQTGISQMWAEAYGAMKHPKTSWDDFASALRALADTQKGE